MYSKELKTIANLHNKIEGSDKFLEAPYYDNESYSSRLSRLSNDNGEFSQCKKVLKEINLESEYNIKIKPLL